MIVAEKCTEYLNEVTLNWPTCWVILGVIAMITIVGYRLTRRD